MTADELEAIRARHAATEVHAVSGTQLRDSHVDRGVLLAEVDALAEGCFNESAKLEAMSAEADRLREALRDVVARLDAPSAPNSIGSWADACNDLSEKIDAAVERARTALAKGSNA
jgi:hypothetical protein